MKISKLYLLLLATLPLLNACKSSDDSTPSYEAGHWAVKGNQYNSYHTTVNGLTMESQCDENHKLFVILGSMPTGEVTLKLVPYSKATLAPDEVKIDVAQDAGLDYLSTGTGNTEVDVHYISLTGFAPDILYLQFNDISMQGYGTNGPIAGDSTVVSGYLQLQ